MEERVEHTPEEVRTIIKHAKLHESELTDVSQVLEFGFQNTASNNLCLMQLDNHLLSEILKGNEIVFKGDHNENAVLCTGSKTYDIKEAETSNSLLLLPDLLWANETKPDQAGNDSINKSSTSDTSPNTSLNHLTESDDGPKSPRKVVKKEILKTFNSYYELRECKPRMGKLKLLLDATKYSGPEYEYKIDKEQLLTYNMLIDKVQASRKELLLRLNLIGAIQIDGFYRLLEFDYEFRILSYMLDLIEENSWPLDKIIKDVTFDSLKSLVPMEVLGKMFEFYTEFSAVENDCIFYSYNEGKVCKFLANVLLKSSGKFNLNEFLQVWKESVPAGMNADESFLRGMALIDRESNPQVIWAFPEANLPENINERFRILFQTKQKWTADEIAPYIECFTTEKLNVNSLLVKYARAFSANGLRYFCAKHNA